MDAERPDDTHLITIVAGLEKTKVHLPRTLTCTLSPVIADMMQKALKQQQKNYGAFEHVPRFKEGVEVNDDENILDFASHGQARLRNPTLFLRNTSPATVEALAYWLANPAASMLSEGKFRQMLLFDMTEKHNDYCKCGLMASFPPSTYCAEHDPTVAISLICFAEEFQMTKLQHGTTKGLLVSCGIHQIVDKQLERPGSPHSVTFERCLADKVNAKTAIQYFRLTMTKEAAEKGVIDLTGAEYQISGLRKGELEIKDDGVERNTSFWGRFEVHFEMHSVTQDTLACKLKRVVLGK